MHLVIDSERETGNCTVYQSIESAAANSLPRVEQGYCLSAEIDISLFCLLTKRNKKTIHPGNKTDKNAQRTVA